MKNYIGLEIGRFGEYNERDFLEPTTENRKEEKKRRDALLRKFRADPNVPQEHMDLFDPNARRTRSGLSRRQSTLELDILSGDVAGELDNKQINALLDSEVGKETESIEKSNPIQRSSNRRSIMVELNEAQRQQEYEKEASNEQHAEWQNSNLGVQTLVTKEGEEINVPVEVIEFWRDMEAGDLSQAALSELIRQHTADQQRARLTTAVRQRVGQLVYEPQSNVRESLNRERGILPEVDVGQNRGENISPRAVSQETELPPYSFPRQFPQMQMSVLKPGELTRLFNQWKIEFKGEQNEDIEEFFELVEERRRIDMVSDSQMLQGLWILLKGPALTTLRVHADEWNTYIKARKGLGNVFKDEAYTQRLDDELRARLQKDKEPVEQYMNDMLIIYRRMKVQPSDKVKIERIYRNMRKEFHTLLRPYMSFTLKEFMHMASEFGKAFEAGQQQKQLPSQESKKEEKQTQEKKSKGDKITDVQAISPALRADNQKILAEELAKLGLGKNQQRGNQNNNNGNGNRNNFQGNQGGNYQANRGGYNEQNFPNANRGYGGNNGNRGFNRGGWNRGYDRGGRGFSRGFNNNRGYSNSRGYGRGEYQTNEGYNDYQNGANNQQDSQNSYPARGRGYHNRGEYYGRGSGYSRGDGNNRYNNMGYQRNYDNNNNNQQSKEANGANAMTTLSNEQRSQQDKQNAGNEALAE